MQNRLLLSLWLVGAVLYAGSTIFLAHSILGGGTQAGDKAKPLIVAAATPEVQCPQQVSAPAVSAPAVEASAPKAETAPAQAADGAQVAPKSRSVASLPSSEDQQPSASRQPFAASPSPDASEQQGAATPDSESAPLPDDRQGQEATAPDAAPDQGQAEWANVMASAAVHSEPSAQAPMIYALPAGRQLRVLAHSNGWAQVQDPSSGATGWVEARVLAPGSAAGGRPGYDNPNEDAYADDGDRQDDWRWQRRHRQGGGFGDFVRRALGGF